MPSPDGHAVRRPVHCATPRRRSPRSRGLRRARQADRDGCGDLVGPPERITPGIDAPGDPRYTPGCFEPLGFDLCPWWGRGAVGARFLGMEEVTGSNPVGSTNPHIFNRSAGTMAPSGAFIVGTRAMPGGRRAVGMKRDTHAGRGISLRFGVRPSAGVPGSVSHILIRCVA